MDNISGPNGGRPATLDDLLRLRRLASTFRQLDSATLERLAAGARVHTVRAGTRILKRGAAGRSVYWVVEGGTVAAIYAHGAARVLEQHGPGAYFGELGALTRTTRQVDVIAARDTTLLELPYDTLAVLLDDAAARKQIIGGLLQRWHQINADR